MVIIGTNEDEFFRSTANDDEIDARGGDDLVYGSIGNDILDGGIGYDTLIFSHGNQTNFPIPIGPIAYTLTSNGFVSSDGAVNTAFQNFESFSFNLQTDQNTVFDASGFTSLIGDLRVATGSGDDSIIGSEQNDLILLGFGNDVVDGRGGTDTIVFAASGDSSLVVVEGNEEEFSVAQGLGPSLSATQVEQLIISAPSNSGLEVDATGLEGVSLTLVATSESDTFYGSQGDDIFDMSASNATESGISQDTIFGNGGINTYDFSEGHFDGVTIADFRIDDQLAFYTIFGSIRLQVEFHYGDLTGSAFEMAYFWADGDTFIVYDANGDGVADQTMVLNGLYVLEARTTEYPYSGYLDQIVITTEDTNVALTENADVFWGGKGADTVSALGGNDEVYGGVGNDNLDGGDGDDRLFGNNDEDTLLGGLGDDELSGGNHNDVLYGEDGADLLIGNRGADRMNGGAGDDNLYGGYDNDRLGGGDGRDVLNGGEGNDLLFGGQGTDVLYGDLGNDGLYGGLGMDFLYGGRNDDFLRGNEADDYLNGEYGHDELRGDEGNDTLIGGFGDDKLDGGIGEDLLRGGDGNDTLIGGDGHDNLGGGDGDDSLIGGAGRDVIDGSNGADVLRGGADNDRLSGGYGADNLGGGEGKDHLTGGGGADVFLFGSAADLGVSVGLADVITDFTKSDGDLINLSGVDADTTSEGDQGFAFVGTSAFSGTAGELRYVQGETQTIVEMDVDGDGNADLYLVLDGVIDLTAGDFLL